MGDGEIMSSRVICPPPQRNTVSAQYNAANWTAVNLGDQSVLGLNRLIQFAPSRLFLFNFAGNPGSNAGVVWISLQTGIPIPSSTRNFEGLQNGFPVNFITTSSDPDTTPDAFMLVSNDFDSEFLSSITSLNGQPYIIALKTPITQFYLSLQG
jgi:hypothetical protein